MAALATIAPGLVALAGQLALGAMLHALAASLLRRSARGRGGRLRRRFVLGREAAHGLTRALFPCGALAVVAFAVAVRGGTLRGASSFWTPALAGTAATSGCFVLLHAAYLERRGRVRTARRVAWLGGTAAVIGALVLLVVVFTELLFDAPLRRAVLLRSVASCAAVALGMIGVGIGGFIAAAGGLARKPRPSAYFALGLYLAGLLALLGALTLAGGTGLPDPGGTPYPTALFTPPERS